VVQVIIETKLKGVPYPSGYGSKFVSRPELPLEEEKTA